jgi:pyruvate dehydrogenase (quinone)
MTTVAEDLVARVAAWGVSRVFGYPGEAIHPVMAALADATDRIVVVQACDSEMAGLMACGYAKISQTVGVVFSGAGAAATHLVTGLVDARADHQSVVAIIGQQPRATLGGLYREELELEPLFKSIAPEFVHVVTTPEQLRHVVDRAFRVAISERTPTCILIPVDVQDLTADEPGHEHDTIHSGVGYSAPRVVPTDADLRRAADALNAGSRVAMLIGVGARDAADEVLHVADVLGAGVSKALLGKAVVPDDIPFVTGGIGLLGTGPSYTMMQSCDTLLMVGSRFPYGEFLPAPGTARGVQIDLDGPMLGLRYPMEVNLVGDAAETLRALAPLLVRKDDRSWRTSVEADVRDWWETLERRAQVDADPINPQRLFHELSPMLPDGAMLACDTGNSVIWFSRHLKMRRGMDTMHSGFLSAMGAAIPYAVAAKLASPNRPAFAFVGDGAMQMRGIGQLATVARHWKSWADPRFIIVVLNDGTLGMDAWEERVLRAEPVDLEMQTLASFSYAGCAQLYGLHGITVERPDAISAALEEALGARVPVVLDVRSDPHVPPLPPRISMRQAASYALAMMKGDAAAMATMKASIAEFFA